MVEKKMVEEKAISAYVLGILGIIFAVMVSPLASIVMNIIGLVQSMKVKDELGKKAKRLNIIGLVVGIVVFILTIILVKLGVSNYLLSSN
jgi:hypothetical protein